METSDFQTIQLEYKEASALFQRGFDLVFNLVRGFLNFNGMMLGIIAIAFRIGNSPNFSFIVIAFSVIGITGSLLTAIVHIRMAEYLRWWLKRASDIEIEFGGQLFRETFRKEDDSRKYIFESYMAALALYCLFAGAWILLLVAAKMGWLP